MRRKELPVVLAVAVLLASLVAACAPTPQVVEKEVEKVVTQVVQEVVKETVIVEGTPQTVEKEVTRVMEVTPTPEPIVITILQGVDPVSMDPQVGESGPKINVLIHMFDTLTAINDDMEIVPQAAESWEVSEDNLTWRIKLRHDIHFWNGAPLDANAVKYTIDRTMNEELRAQGLNDAFPSRVKLVGAEVVDDYTVDIITETPQPLMPMWLTYLLILEPSHYESISFDEASINPMGSGAFKFVEWVKDDHVTLERNPDWWGGQPQISKLIFRPVPEAAVRLSELETGAADLVVDLKPEDMARVATMPNARIASVQGGRRIHIGFNTHLDYFKDTRVRQAFNYAVNWDEINQALLGGLAPDRLVTVSAGWVPEDLKPYPYDPEKAKALLAEAGFPMDKQLIINTPNGRYLKDVEIAQAVAAQLGQIGLQVEVVPLEWSVMNEMIQNKDMKDMWLLGLGSRLNGLQDITSALPDDLFNPGGWDNPAFVAAYEKASSYMDVEEQKPPAQEAMRIAYDDPPWIYLYRQIAIYGTSSRLSNWQPRPDERIRLDTYEFK
jgi:peptide/nickel transport system substrate-binding protein